MRLLLTGGSGVLGRAFLPLALETGHKVAAPRRQDLDLFNPVQSVGRCRTSMWLCISRLESRRPRRCGCPMRGPKRPLALAGLASSRRRGARWGVLRLRAAHRHLCLPAWGPVDESTPPCAPSPVISHPRSMRKRRLLASQRRGVAASFSGSGCCGDQGHGPTRRTPTMARRCTSKTQAGRCWRPCGLRPGSTT